MKGLIVCGQALMLFVVLAPPLCAAFSENQLVVSSVKTGSSAPMSTALLVQPLQSCSDLSFEEWAGCCAVGALSGYGAGKVLHKAHNFVVNNYITNAVQQEKNDIAFNKALCFVQAGTILQPLIVPLLAVTTDNQLRRTLQKRMGVHDHDIFRNLSHGPQGLGIAGADPGTAAAWAVLRTCNAWSLRTYAELEEQKRAYDTAVQNKVLHVTTCEQLIEAVVVNHLFAACQQNDAQDVEVQKKYDAFCKGFQDNFRSAAEKYDKNTLLSYSYTLSNDCKEQQKIIAQVRENVGDTYAKNTAPWRDKQYGLLRYGLYAAEVTAILGCATRCLQAHAPEQEPLYDRFLHNPYVYTCLSAMVFGLCGYIVQAIQNVTKAGLSQSLHDALFNFLESVKVCCSKEARRKMYEAKKDCIEKHGKALVFAFDTSKQLTEKYNDSVQQMQYKEQQQQKQWQADLKREMQLVNSDLMQIKQRLSDIESSSTIIYKTLNFQDTEARCRYDQQMDLLQQYSQTLLQLCEETNNKVLYAQNEHQQLLAKQRELYDKQQQATTQQMDWAYDYSGKLLQSLQNVIKNAMEQQATVQRVLMQSDSKGLLDVLQNSSHDLGKSFENLQQQLKEQSKCLAQIEQQLTTMQNQTLNVPIASNYSSFGSSTEVVEPLTGLSSLTHAKALDTVPTVQNQKINSRGNSVTSNTRTRRSVVGKTSKNTDTIEVFDVEHANDVE